MQSTNPPHTSDDRITADVAVIGDGIVGLSTALELGRAGVRCALIGTRKDGAASGAAAGLLAPSIGSLSGSVRTFFLESLARYSSYLAGLTAYDSELRLLRGLIEVLTDRRTTAGHASATLMSAQTLADLEPSVRAPHGAILHAEDAALDNVRLVAALRKAIADQANVQWLRDDAAVTVDVETKQPVVTLASGAAAAVEHVVLAAGAWSPLLAGLPRKLPVRPLKGQMLAVRSTALRHPIMGNDVYLVPRAGEVVIGATVEEAGFDLSVDDESIEALRRAAVEIVPSLEDAPVLRRWAGVRPATPDMLPILGPDPAAAQLIYACGHSKNGILLAPLTAAVITQLIVRGSSEIDLTPFAAGRFEK
jgi:glycine oxidase